MGSLSISTPSKSKKMESKPDIAGKPQRIMAPDCGITGTEHHGISRRIAGGTGAAAGRERNAEEASGPDVAEGEREGRSVGIRAGTVPRHALPRAVGKAAGHGGRYPPLHSGSRHRAE